MVAPPLEIGAAALAIQERAVELEKKILWLINHARERALAEALHGLIHALNRANKDQGNQILDAIRKGRTALALRASPAPAGEDNEAFDNSRIGRDWETEAERQATDRKNWISALRAQIQCGRNLVRVCEKNELGVGVGMAHELLALLKSSSPSLPEWKAIETAPKGWKLVPEEPTRDMITAFVDGETDAETVKVRYQAMLAAAPTGEE